MSGTVLLIQNDQARRRLVHAQLEPRGHTVIDGGLGPMAHDLTVTTRPDLVIVDAEIAGALAPNFLDEMKSDVRISDVPVLVTNTSRITDLVVDVEVRLQIAKMQTNAPVDVNQTTDALTGLFCASHMKTEVAHFRAIAQRYKQALSLVLIGLDRFERTNRSFGSDAGDEVLCDVAQRLVDDVRETDIVGRWHADKFMAILPCTPKEGAAFLAERFRETLAESHHTLGNGHAVSITASFGCSGLGQDDLIDAAESALRNAKRNGRNTVSVAPS